MTKFYIIAGCMALAFSTASSTSTLQERNIPLRHAPATTHEALQDHNIPLGLALEIAQEAVQACAEKTYSVSAAVVDRGGILRALLRADNAGIHTPGAARRKAYTSASARRTTGDMMRSIQQNADAAQLVAIDDFLVLAGGVPIQVGGETIGAVGVGGAPGGDVDEDCAMAALEKVADKLK